MLRSNQIINELINAVALNASHNQFCERVLQPSEFLIRQGYKTEEIYIVKSGIVKCFIREANGKEYLLELLGVGEIIGEIEVIRNTPCISSVEALTHTTVYQIDSAYFLQQLKQNPHLLEILLKILADRLTNTAVRASYQQTYPLIHNLIKLLQYFSAQTEIQISKEDLAAYLGVSIRSINRSLKFLRSENMLSISGLKLTASEQEIDAFLMRFID